MQHAIFQAKHIFIENWLTYHDPLLRHLKIELKQNKTEQNQTLFGKVNFVLTFWIQNLNTIKYDNMYL